VNPPAAPTPLVCHVIYRLDYGGLENGLVNLVNHLPRDRYRHTIVCLAGYGAMRDRIARDDVDVLSIDKRPGKDLPSYVRLWKLLKTLRPDIVHTRNLGTVDLQWVAWAAGVRSRVHGEHGWESTDPTGDDPHHRRIRRACRPVIQRWVAMSRDIALWLEQSVGINAGVVRQLYNGVDTRRFSPGCQVPGDWPWQQTDRSDLMVFGTVGRLDTVKNHAPLLRAFRGLVDADPVHHRNLRLVIVGDGPLRQALADEIVALGLGDSVWLTGARADVPALMNAFDVFVLPSINEGISNTTLEAMASGLPVVATRVGGNPEIVIDGETGILCAGTTPQALADAMGHYRRNPEIARRHGASGRARAVERFSLDSMMRGYLRLYDELLAGGPLRAVNQRGMDVQT